MSAPHSSRRSPRAATVCLVAVLLLPLWISGCDPAAFLQETEDPVALLGPVQGTASWYGYKYAGRSTANGETFDPEGLTAAHRTLPFGTRVRVTRADNGATVTVRINDRGPEPRDRIIDLALGAAREIDMVDDGLVTVRLEILK
ncbi:MAG: septal ring lytic transglycosylase RlpA family protein [Bacteroidota bacterium]